MATNFFSARVRKKNGVTFIDLSGEINSVAEPMLDAAYRQAVETNPTSIVLNFSDVSYINSTGIALVVRLLSLTRNSNIALFSYGLSQHYLEIFKITRLSDFIEIHPDEASVIAAVAA